MTATADSKIFSRVSAALRQEQLAKEREPQITQLGSLWRVTAYIDGSRSPVWESTSQSECEQIVATIAGIQLKNSKWHPPFNGPYSKSLGNGLGLEISSRKATLTLNMEPIGTYDFAVNDWPGAHVIGRMTLSGNVRLKNGFTGKGYAARFYDGIEEALGLPIVPHGHNGVHGTVSPMASKFWKKRVAGRDVPGFSDPAAEKRYAELKRATAYIDTEVRCKNNPYFLVAAAEITGATIRIPGASASDTGLVHLAWCVTDSGIAFDAGGLIDEASEIDYQTCSMGRSIFDTDGDALLAALSTTHWPDTRNIGQDTADAYLILTRHGLTPKRTLSDGLAGACGSKPAF